MDCARPLNGGRYGRTYWGALRATFVPEEGVVRHVIAKVEPREHDEQVLQALAACGSVGSEVMRALPLVLLALALAAPAPASAEPTACRHADEVPTAETIPQSVTAVLCLVNEARLARGRKAVRWHPLLAFPEHDYAQRMVRGGFFDHVAPDGSTAAERLDLYRVDDAEVGEVLAWGGPRRATPRSALTMWLGSRVHRRVLLARRWRHAGVGLALGAPVTDRPPGVAVTWAMAFGRPTPRLLERALERLRRRGG